jgi:hypothetical protein
VSTTIEHKKKNKSPSGWDLAITRAQAKIEELKRAVSIFEDQKRRGEPWPGEKALLGQQRDL